MGSRIVKVTGSHSRVSIVVFLTRIDRQSGTGGEFTTVLFVRTWHIDIATVDNLLHFGLLLLLMADHFLHVRHTTHPELQMFYHQCSTACQP